MSVPEGALEGRIKNMPSTDDGAHVMRIGHRDPVLPVRPVAPVRPPNHDDRLPRDEPYDREDEPADRDHGEGGRPKTDGVDEMA